MEKVTIQVELKPYEFYCDKCQTIHTQSSYAVAQLTMGYSLVFTCECGNKINLNP